MGTQQLLLTCVLVTIIVAEALAIYAIAKAKVEKNSMLSWTTVHGDELNGFYHDLIDHGYIIPEIDVTFETEPDGTITAMVAKGGRTVGCYRL